MCGEAVEGGGVAAAAAVEVVVVVVVVGVLPVEAVEQRWGRKGGGMTQTNSTPVVGCSCGWVQ